MTWDNNSMSMFTGGSGSMDPLSLMSNISPYLKPIQMGGGSSQAPGFDFMKSLQGFGSDASQMDSRLGFDFGGLGSMGNSTPTPSGMSFFGRDGQQGYGGALMQGLSSLGGLALGMKQYGIAKDTLNFQKDAFKKNFGMQYATTMDALGRRNDLRVAEGRMPSQPTNDYLAAFDKLRGG